MWSCHFSQLTVLLSCFRWEMVFKFVSLENLCNQDINLLVSDCSSFSDLHSWSSNLSQRNQERNIQWRTQERRLLSVSMCVCVCVCVGSSWEGQKIINTERSQGQIVINTVKPRGNRCVCVCVCVCVRERHGGRQRRAHREWLGKRGMKL